MFAKQLVFTAQLTADQQRDFSPEDKFQYLLRQVYQSGQNEFE